MRVTSGVFLSRHFAVPPFCLCFLSVESATSEVVGDNDVRDGVEYELDVVRVCCARLVTIDLFRRALVLRLELRLDIGRGFLERLRPYNATVLYCIVMRMVLCPNAGSLGFTPAGDEMAEVVSCCLPRRQLLWMSNLSKVATQWLEVFSNLRPSGYKAQNIINTSPRPTYCIVLQCIILHRPTVLHTDFYVAPLTA